MAEASTYQLGFEEMERKILSGDATDVTFLGLHGDTDRTYLLICSLLAGSGGGSAVTVQPNAVNTNQFSTLSVATDAAVVGASVAELRLAGINGGSPSAARMILFAQTGMRRATEGAYIAGAAIFATPIGVNFFGEWNETTTEITSLKIVSSVANGLGTGSILTLYRIRSFA